MKIEVDREAWSRVQSFKDSRPDDRHYVLQVDPDGNGSISFGDGREGRRPPAASKITATYRFGGGSTGNVKKEGRRICVSIS